MSLDCKELQHRHTFAVFKGSVCLCDLTKGVEFPRGLGLLLRQPLLVHLLLPGLWSQVRAALPLCVGRWLQEAFGFRPIKASGQLFRWLIRSGHLGLLGWR